MTLLKTYSFTASSIIYAAQVNANFTDLGWNIQGQPGIGLAAQVSSTTATCEWSSTNGGDDVAGLTSSTVAYARTGDLVAFSANKSGVGSNCTGTGSLCLSAPVTMADGNYMIGYGFAKLAASATGPIAVYKVSGASKMRFVNEATGADITPTQLSLK